MKLQPIYLADLGVVAFTCVAIAGSRTSTDYSISAESINQGGATLTSANYSVNASINDSGAAVSEMLVWGEEPTGSTISTTPSATRRNVSCSST